MLDILNLETWPKPESVSILVGANGSGKSSYLRKIAQHYCANRNVVIVCNTPHDRFVGLRGARRISVGQTAGSPRTIVKRAVAQSLLRSDATYHKISSTLDHCGYQARFGFLIEPGPLYGKSEDEILFRQAGRNITEVSDEFEDKLISINDSINLQDSDLALALAFLQRHQPSDKVWLDASEKALEFSRAREFAFVLKLESKLRGLNVLRSIRVFLQKSDSGDLVEMQHASSGQLALISSLLFVINNTVSDSIVIIDEPENSLHPSWQSEYVDKVLAALSYLNASVIVATHAPLVVTGALGQNSNLVSVFEVINGTPKRLRIERDANTRSGIEEILWRVFEVVTPANHFVSEQIVDEVSRFEKGEVKKEEVLDLIHRMERESFDKRQQNFFIQVKRLLDKVEATRNMGPDDRG